MPDADVIAYLKANLNKYPVDALRAQLAQEGVTEAEFDEALKTALRGQPGTAPKAGALASGAGAAEAALRKRKQAFLALCAGVGGLVGFALFALNEKPAPKPASATPALSDTGESAYIGRQGYVIRLPRGYVAVAQAPGVRPNLEVVHFCKTGTDPTSFSDEGLFGPLGIVRLEVFPDPAAASLQGLSYLNQRIVNAANARKEKFTTKNIEVGTLQGFTVTYEAPFPRLETYILGKTLRFTFVAGQEDATYHDLVMSLRETPSAP